jgi:hypothetical protein
VTVMRWNSAMDSLPEDKQEILLKHNGILYLAKYDSQQNVFVTKQNDMLKCEAGDCWSGMVDVEEREH